MKTHLIYKRLHQSVFMGDILKYIPNGKNGIKTLAYLM